MPPEEDQFQVAGDTNGGFTVRHVSCQASAASSQAGFAMMDTLMAITIFMLFIPSLVYYMNSANEMTVKNAAAAQMKIINKAMEQYVQDNYQALLMQATAVHGHEIPFTELTNNSRYLPATYQNMTPYKQTYRFFVLQPIANNLQAMVITEGGRDSDNADIKFRTQTIPAVAALIGPAGGCVPEPGSTPSAVAGRAIGSFGTWLYDFAGKDIPSPDPGHLVSMLFFERGALAANYLWRIDAGNQTLNTMETDLHMGQQQILDAREVQIRDGVSGKDTTMYQNGSSFTVQQSAGDVKFTTIGGPNAYADLHGHGLLDEPNGKQVVPAGDSEINNLQVDGTTKLIGDVTATGKVRLTAGNVTFSDLNGGTWTLNDLLPSLIAKESYLVKHDDKVIKPTCAIGMTPKIYLTPSTIASNNAGTTPQRAGFAAPWDVNSAIINYSATTGGIIWSISILTYYPDTSTWKAATDAYAIASIYCGR